MTIYYLYIKEHIKTELKYFGKTDTKNPYILKDSGVDWRKHLLEHSEEDVITLQLFEFHTKEDRTIFAIKFSKDNDIVKSSNWANLKPENGKCGGGGFIMSDESKKKSIM